MQLQGQRAPLQQQQSQPHLQPPVAQEEEGCCQQQQQPQETQGKGDSPSLGLHCPRPLANLQWTLPAPAQLLQPSYGAQQ